MTPPQRRLLHLATILAGGTGLVLAWMVFLSTPPEAWSVVNHPWQPTVQHLHVLAAPLLVFAVGLVWTGHVVAHWREGRRRRGSGTVLAVLFSTMAASGFLLQVSVEPRWREVWSLLHTGASVAWLLTLALHVSRARSPGTVKGGDLV